MKSAGSTLDARIIRAGNEPDQIGNHHRNRVLLLSLLPRTTEAKEIFT